MPVSYNIVARPNPKNPGAPKKYYPSVKATGRTDLIRLAQGHIVDLGAFGSFSRKDTGTVWLRNTAAGMDEEEQVTAEQVTNLLVRFLPGQELKRALKDTHLVKACRRTVRSSRVYMR